MKWHKLGMVFSPSKRYFWMQTHAQLPVAYHLGDNLYRVYFSSRDEQNRSHTGYVDFNIYSPREILNVSSVPLLSPGPLGHFDDHGVYTSSILEYGEQLWMYIIGWSPGVRPPLFYTSVGLAISKDRGNTFTRIGKAPIMSRSEFDPCLVTSPFVLLDQDVWRMWYVSGFKWEEEDNILKSFYNIKYAESKNGVDWERRGLVCIELKSNERNIGRPCVLRENVSYKMWYPYDAGQGYRIGYAESDDGYVWTRKDEETGIDVSPSGWDSQAITYPWVFRHRGKKYMLYNGNSFGREGFGLAVEED